MKYETKNYTAISNDEPSEYSGIYGVYLFHNGELMQHQSWGKKPTLNDLKEMCEMYEKCEGLFNKFEQFKLFATEDGLEITDVEFINDKCVFKLEGIDVEINDTIKGTMQNYYNFVINVCFPIIKHNASLKEKKDEKLN